MVADRSDRERILLILDLDETLIHASEQELQRPADFRLFGYHIDRRPHLSHFLDRCSQDFELAVWSSASDDYVDAVCERIFPHPSLLKFVWGRSRATLRRSHASDDAYFWYPDDHRHYLKPLAKLKRRGWRLERVLIVDDTPEKCIRNYGNAIYTQAYEGDETDTELILLAAYLNGIKDCPNVRAVEKRRWRTEMTRLSAE